MELGRKALLTDARGLEAGRMTHGLQRARVARAGVELASMPRPDPKERRRLVEDARELTRPRTRLWCHSEQRWPGITLFETLEDGHRLSDALPTVRLEHGEARGRSERTE